MNNKFEPVKVYLQQSTVCALVSLLCCAALAPSPLLAEEIYKVVDEHGNVTYSTQPPVSGENAEVIDTPAPPSEEEVAAAKERQKKLEEELRRQEALRTEAARQQAAESERQQRTIVQTHTTVLPAPYYNPRYPRRDYAPPRYRPGHRPPHRPPHQRPHRPRPLPY